MVAGAQDTAFLGVHVTRWGGEMLSLRCDIVLWKIERGFGRPEERELLLSLKRSSALTA